VSTIEITEPGVYPGLPAEVYHAQRDSLSSSGARRILETCPAKFRYGKQEHKPEFDLGHAAHALVLGDGPVLAVIDATDWRTKRAQAERDAAREQGHVPLLRSEYEQVVAMARALREHPLAAALLAEEGAAEQSIFWRDRETGVMLRCRPDWMTPRWYVDYKTTADASPDAIARSIHKWGYHQQAAFYLDGLTAGGFEDLPILFIFQERTAPYLVTVVQLDEQAMAIGAQRNRRAIDLFAECLHTGHWPGYANDVVLTSLPPYALRDLEYS